ncbi:hypothetical protein EDD90_5930 [Streptomyces sp. Ag109_O5-1]|uniref:hypothetical protein n=1 Tax=Streptomyces sp. Ag109_O5-1 TaxID=1938851 RepID=UPI000F9145EF|nr:hypothetical protein [Streptomyces sp. Ag109_O5-1]RPE42768.1 hypothetical protein EDD90_5930 [Streptomyces sp. Ag109_O5-1]
MTTQISQATRVSQVTQVSHTTAADGPAGITLALAVAYELHAPTEAAVPTVTPPAPRTPEAAPAPRAPEATPVSRAPEVAPAPQLMGLRTSAARPHQRKVQLSRMTLVRG